MPSSTVEDYLKALYTLGKEKKQVALGAISEHLSLTPGTVTTMMKHLQVEGYVSYEPRKGVTLETKGNLAALQVLRRHRLIELFLVEIMHLDWSQVHEEAEILEHVLSDTLVQRIDEMLGHPSYDPHGDPIPNSAGEIKTEHYTALCDAPAGLYHLKRVTRDDATYLTWLSDHGLKPGTRFEVVARDALAGVISLKIGKKTIQIGDSAAANLLVEAA